MRIINSCIDSCDDLLRRILALPKKDEEMKSGIPFLTTLLVFQKKNF
jgi:hypothetical protein